MSSRWIQLLTVETNYEKNIFNFAQISYFFGRPRLATPAQPSMHRGDRAAVCRSCSQPLWVGARAGTR
jgi:hypothetical protein